MIFVDFISSESLINLIWKSFTQFMSDLLKFTYR